VVSTNEQHRQRTVPAQFQARMCMRSQTWLQDAKGKRPPQRASVRECAVVCAIAGHACISCDALNILSARWHEIRNMQENPVSHMVTADVDSQAFNSNILELDSAPYKDLWHHRQHSMILNHHISLISHGMPFCNWCIRSEIREYVQQFGRFLRLKERESVKSTNSSN
jgi:hypothetical protein